MCHHQRGPEARPPSCYFATPYFTHYALICKTILQLYLSSPSYFDWHIMIQETCNSWRADCWWMSTISALLDLSYHHDSDRKLTGGTITRNLPSFFALLAPNIRWWCIIRKARRREKKKHNRCLLRPISSTSQLGSSRFVVPFRRFCSEQSISWILFIRLLCTHIHGTYDHTIYRIRSTCILTTCMHAYI
jgi:hypothetical protein